MKGVRLWDLARMKASGHFIFERPFYSAPAFEDPSIGVMVEQSEIRNKNFASYMNRNNSKSSGSSGGAEEAGKFAQGGTSTTKFANSSSNSIRPASYRMNPHLLCAGGREFVALYDVRARGKKPAREILFFDNSTIVKVGFSGVHCFAQSFSNRQFYFDLRRV